MDKPQSPEEKYGIMLPCAPDDFGRFISSLLGKPQTIEKSIRGVFCVSKDEISSTFHLVDQRIWQQNGGVLTQFTVKIFYDDDSSVFLNSIEDFHHYSEVRPLNSIGVTLSWTYLIKFMQKTVPEKQQIDLSFRADANGDVIFEDGLYMSRGRRWFGPTGVFLRISHTERTWGLDIESLLTGHVKTLLVSPDSKKNFISKHSTKIGFAVAALFFISALVGSYVATNRFITSYTATVKDIGKDLPSSTSVISAKIDFLVNVITQGAWPRFILSVVGFVVIALVLSIFLGIWAGESAEQEPESFVLLSKAAEDKRRKVLQKQKRDWIMFILSIITSIATGVLGNILFAKYFGKL